MICPVCGSDDGLFMLGSEPGVIEVRCSPCHVRVDLLPAPTLSEPVEMLDPPPAVAGVA